MNETGAITKVLMVIFFILVGYIYSKSSTSIIQPTNISYNQNSTDEEKVIVTTVKNSLPSVVTVAADNQNIGSGFIVSSNGSIVTSKHVVGDTTVSYQVITNDNQRYPADNIFRDPLNDLAVVKINAKGLKPFVIGSSNNLELGQTVIAIGTPLGEFQNTVTVGIVSGLNRQIIATSASTGSIETLTDLIQTDAPISPGNSGGPLLNTKGEVVGVNTAVSLIGENIGFAIPADSVKSLVNTLAK